MTGTPWRIVADEITSCNCAWGCPCQYNALPTRGRCEAIVAIHIRDGYYGVTNLDGLSFATGYWWPGPIHEGDGVAQLVIDDKAAPEQRSALVNITSGREGGTLFEVYAVVVSKTLDPIYAPIAFHADWNRRVAHVVIPGLGEFRAEPIRNPVTGEEHHVRLELPNGFEFKVAEMANCVEQHATIDDKRISNRNTHAHFASVDWTNG
jgi:hypothetical protein